MSRGLHTIKTKSQVSATQTPPITLTLYVLISVLWETFGAQFIIANVRDSVVSQTACSSSVPSMLDVMMTMSSLPPARYVDCSK